jgi:protein gp37
MSDLTLPVIEARQKTPYKKKIKKLNHQWRNKHGGRGIQWTDQTGNDGSGCEHDCEWNLELPDGEVKKVICYAKALVDRMPHHWQYGFKHYYYDPTLLESIRKETEPQLIFLGSMTDNFGAWVPRENTELLLSVLEEKPQITFQLLTKDAKRTLLFNPPPNAWMGFSSAPDFMRGKELSPAQKEAFMWTVLNVAGEWKARKRLSWLSLEPLSWDVAHVIGRYAKEHNQLPFGWAVIGAGSSGRELYQPNLSHVSRILELVDHYKVPVFFKGNLAHDPQIGQWREDFPINGIYYEAVVQRQLNALKFGWPANNYLTTDIANLTAMLKQDVF